MKPVYVPPALADLLIGELGVLPDGVEIMEKLPERVLIIGAGHDRFAHRIVEQLRGAMAGVTITLHDEVPPEHREEPARGLMQTIGRMPFNGYASGSMLEAIPREPKRVAQWKSERNGRRS